MATWFAQNSSVNIDSVNQWNDAAGGGGSWLTWASLAAGDILVANGKTSITINVNVTCATLTTVATGGTAGGGFFLAAGVTVTANVVAGTTACIVRGVSGASSFIIGNVTGGASSSAIGFSNTGTGTVTVTGNVSGGSAGFASGCSNSSTGTINIIGNVTAGSAGNCYGAVNGSTGNMTVTGNVTGGSSDSTYGVINNGAGGLTVTGIVTGGSSTNSWGAGNAAGGLLTIIGNVISGGNATAYGAYNSSTGAVTVTGNVTGGISRGAYNNSTGTLTINGDVNAGSGSGQYGIYSVSTGKCILNGNAVSNTFGDTGFVAARVLIPAATNISHTYRIDSGGAAGIARSLYTGGISVGHPATTDVRSGTTFGAVSEYTGTLAVPSPTLVAIGVATDNTVGSYEPGGGLDAAGVRTAIGLTSANLDTQLSGLATQTSVNAIDDLLDTEMPALTLAVAAVQSDTNDIQSTLAAGVELDSATAAKIDSIKSKTDNLPADPADASDIASSFGTVNGKLDTIDDLIDTEVSAIASAVAALNNISPAQVNAELVDVLSVDTFAELTAPPAATSSLKDKITWLFMYARNKVTQTALERKLYLDDTTTVAGTSATSDNGTTFTKGEDS